MLPYYPNIRSRRHPLPLMKICAASDKPVSQGLATVMTGISDDRGRSPPFPQTGLWRRYARAPTTSRVRPEWGEAHIVSEGATMKTTMIMVTAVGSALVGISIGCLLPRRPPSDEVAGYVSRLLLRLAVIGFFTGALLACAAVYGFNRSTLSLPPLAFTPSGKVVGAMALILSVVAMICAGTCLAVSRRWIRAVKKRP